MNTLIPLKKDENISRNSYHYFKLYLIYLRAENDDIVIRVMWCTRL